MSEQRARLAAEARRRAERTGLKVKGFVVGFVLASVWWGFAWWLSSGASP